MILIIFSGACELQDKLLILLIAIRYTWKN